MRRRRPVLLALAVLAALTACGHPEVLPGGRPVPTSGPTTVPFDLYTHCGIYELTYEGRWYERSGGYLEPGLTEPPGAWDDPYQGGTLTIDDQTAVFTDEKGHRETFRLRRGATAPKEVCS